MKLQEKAKPSRVDPRVRGGDPAPRGRGFWPAGRSPRARGRPRIAIENPVCVRSIPACAGETITAYAYNAALQVDPRVRGGDSSSHISKILEQGRSPRARGRHTRGRYELARLGSIPACAGETRSNARALRMMEVDPRVRGGDPRSQVSEDKAKLSKSQLVSPILQGLCARNRPSTS